MKPIPRKPAKANRCSRGDYRCHCGWHMHADLNGAANIFQTAFQVSPFQGASGPVSSPVVQTLWLDTTRFVVCEPASIAHRSTRDIAQASHAA